MPVHVDWLLSSLSLLSSCCRFFFLVFLSSLFLRSFLAVRAMCDIYLQYIEADVCTTTIGVVDIRNEYLKNCYSCLSN
jgi:hypothetical protein